MSKMKKFASLLLALALVFALGVSAFAADIEIQNAKVDETYTAYQIFSATQSGDSITYYITSGSAYYTYISGSELFTLVATGTDGTTYQVTWDEVDNSAIIAYLTSLGAKGTTTYTVTATEVDGTVSATIKDVPAGYYFVTTSTGSVVSIGTAGTTQIQEKNGTPTPSKTVSDTENSSGTDSNTAAIGDTVYYTVTISDADQISNLVVTDTLSAGLTLNENVTVTVDGVAVLATNYTVTYGAYNESTGTTLTIKFEDSYLKTLSSTDVITITYSAVINKNAVVDGNGNTNKVELTYGNGQTSTSTSTTTKVYDFDLSKTTSDGAALSGAEFTLSEGSTAIEFVELTDESGNVTGYRVATAEEKATDGATTTTIKAGSVNISGLDAGDYTLTETKAPDGYNQLAGSVTVTINEEGNVTINNGTSGNTGNATNGTVTVVNQSGSELPSTGGIGTTIFYVIGSIMVLGAVVLLITRKRMSKAE